MTMAYASHYTTDLKIELEYSNITHASSGVILIECI
jgi:hypothetical protein